MKKFVTMMVAAMVALSFSMVAVAAEKKAFKNQSTVKKDVKKKEVKKDEAKPAKKAKKEVSGC